MAPLALTPGEPAGIGPDITLSLHRSAAQPDLVVIADPGLLRDRAQLLGLAIELVEYQGQQEGRPGRLYYLPVARSAPTHPGRLDPANAQYVLDTLALAADGCLSGRFAGLVTGPVQKSLLNDAGIPFSGHTEYLAERAGTDRVVMMLATPSLRVALVTTHLPLADVPAAITAAALEETLRILVADLRSRFRIPAPRILVCGLNPHAGEGGHLGREEIDVIAPVLERLRAAGLQLIGPLPADTAFTPAQLERADAVLAMYHDQGLPVLKSQGFGEAVNITLGLPFLRTSVDHGTALDLAGTGRASEASLRAAVELGRQLADRTA